jgi:sugar phosphate permease
MKLKSSYKLGLALILCYLVAWLDRMTISMTLPFMEKDLGITTSQQGMINSAFFLGYALCQIPGGLLADRFGPRRVILVALVWWSLFTALTGAVSDLNSMLVVRFLFGIGEGIFPAAVWKVIGQWFSKKNRATANALILSAIALGPAITPLIMRPLLESVGWRGSFYTLGAAGILCVVAAWLTITNSIHAHPNVSREELEEFERDARSQAANAEHTLAPVGFLDLLRSPAIWVLFFIALVYNLTMYGWLTWLPTYLMKQKGLDLKSMAWAASLPFWFGTVGVVLGGYVSDRWFRGRRKVLVFGCQVLGGICLFLFTQVTSTTAYTLLQSGAAVLLYMASGAIWAMPMVLLPPKVMGPGSGFINTGGQIGGVLTSTLIGYAIQLRGNDYTAIFDVMLGALVAAALLVLFGIREQKPAQVPAPAVAGAANS